MPTNFLPIATSYLTVEPGSSHDIWIGTSISSLINSHVNLSQWNGTDLKFILIILLPSQEIFLILNCHHLQTYVKVYAFMLQNLHFLNPDLFKWFGQLFYLPNNCTIQILLKGFLPRLLLSSSHTWCVKRCHLLVLWPSLSVLTLLSQFSSL